MEAVAASAEAKPRPRAAKPKTKVKPARPFCIIDQDALRRELQYLQGVIDRKQTIPVLSTVLLQTNVKKNSVVLTGTDLDIYLTGRVTAVVEAAEAFCVSGQTFVNAVRLLPEGSVSLSLESFGQGENETKRLTCKGGEYSFSMPATSVEHYPEVPPFVSKDELKFESGLFRAVIDRVIFAITKEESRYTLSGANMELDKDGTIRFVTTDGHRLALVEVPKAHKRKEEKSVLLSKKTLVEMRKLSNDCEEISLCFDDNHFYIVLGDRQIVSRQLFGQFPNWRMVMPKEAGQLVHFDRSRMDQALRRVFVFADDRSHAVRLGLSKNKLTLSSADSDKGEASDAMKVQYTGSETVIGFNGEYLREWLQAVNVDDLTMSFKDANGQAEFQGVSEEKQPFNYRHVIMPMRI